MSSLGPVGTTVVLLALLALLAAVLVTARGARSRRRALEAELERSRATVEGLADTVARLAEEVASSRTREPVRQPGEREYLITTLTESGRLTPATGIPASGVPAVASPGAPGGTGGVGRVVEDQLVGVLARQRGTSATRDRVVETVVRGVALGHGLRRALAPEARDRAVAVAQVARRASRRERRRELREARRVVRAVRTRQSGEDAA